MNNFRIFRYECDAGHGCNIALADASLLKPKHDDDDLLKKPNLKVFNSLLALNWTSLILGGWYSILGMVVMMRTIW